MTGRREWFIRVPWGKLALVGRGHPDGYPVFLVHGRKDSTSVFEPLIAQMTGTYNFVALDMPGNGLSDAFPPVQTHALRGGDPNYAVMYSKPPHFENAFLDFARYSQGLEYTECTPRRGPKLMRFHFLAAMELAIKHLGWDRFIFIGHSMGCEQGLFYSVIHPGEIGMMILLDAGPTLMRMQVEDHLEYQRYYDSYYEDYVWENFERKPYVKEMALQAIERHRELTRNQSEIIIARNIHGFPFFKERDPEAACVVELKSPNKIHLMRLCISDQSYDKAQSSISQSLNDLRSIENTIGCAGETQTPYTKPSIVQSSCDLRLIEKRVMQPKTPVKKFELLFVCDPKNRFSSSDIPRSITNPIESIVEPKKPPYIFHLVLIFDPNFAFTRSVIVQTLDDLRSIEKPIGIWPEPETPSSKLRIVYVIDPNRRFDYARSSIVQNSDDPRSKKLEKKPLALLTALLLSKAEMAYKELERDDASTSGNEDLNEPQNVTSTERKRERKRKNKNTQTRQVQTREPVLVFRVFCEVEFNKKLNEDEEQNATANGTQNTNEGNSNTNERQNAEPGHSANVAPNPLAPGDLSEFIERLSDDEVGYLSWDNRLKNLAPQNYGNDYYFALFKTIPPTLLIAASDGAKKVPPNPKWRQGAKELLDRMATLDNFKRVDVQGGHDVHFTNPERVIPYINAFLKDNKVVSKL